jgi:LPS export ABC transporter protein LptC
MTRTEFVVAVTIFCATALIACDDKAQPPVAGHAGRADSADQVMYKARFNLTDNGLSRAELTADSALFFDDNTRVELKNIATTFFTITGARDAYLTSLKGTYLSRLGNMWARDSVVVVTEEGRRLETPELKYDQALNQISSDSPFVLTEPGRRLAGVGFRSDPNMQNVQILKTKSGTTGTILLPGQ